MFILFFMGHLLLSTRIIFYSILLIIMLVIDLLLSQLYLLYDPLELFELMDLLAPEQKLSIILHVRTNIYQLNRRQPRLPQLLYIAQIKLYLHHCNSSKLLLTSSVPDLSSNPSAIIQVNSFRSELHSDRRIGSKRFSTFIKYIYEVSLADSSITNDNNYKIDNGLYFYETYHDLPQQNQNSYSDILLFFLNIFLYRF